MQAGRLKREVRGPVEWLTVGSPDFLHGMPDVSALEREPAAELLKSGSGRRTWRVEVSGQRLVVKVADVARLGSAGRVSGWSLRREFRALVRAAERGVPVPDPVAFGVHRRDGRSALIMREVTGAVTLADWISRDFDRGPQDGAAGPLPAVADLFAVAHERGFVHGDAHPGNILVSGSGDVPALFIDLRTSRFAGGSTGVRVSLASLAEVDQSLRRVLSRTQRLRLFKRYLGRRTGPAFRGDDGAVVRRLLRRFAARVDRHERRLYRRRDRRLVGDGKYFGRFARGDWRGVLVLRLARRHVFAEPGVRDRTMEEWTSLLGPLLNGSEASASAPGDVTLHREKVGSLFARLQATLAGHPLERRFLSCHRRRHRDEPAPLLLGLLKRGGLLVDEVVLVSPAGMPMAEESPVPGVAPARAVREV